MSSTSSKPRPTPLWIWVINPCCGQCYWVAKELIRGAWDKHRARGRKWSLPPNWKTWPQPVAARGWAGWWQYAKISPHGITERTRRAASCSWSLLLSYELICMWAFKKCAPGAGISDKKMCRGGRGLCKIVQKVGALSPPHPGPPPPGDSIDWCINCSVSCNHLTNTVYNVRLGLSIQWWVWQKSKLVITASWSWRIDVNNEKV